MSNRDKISLSFFASAIVTKQEVLNSKDMNFGLSLAFKSVGTS